MQTLWIQEASKSGKFVTKKVGTSVIPTDSMTRPMPRSKIEQLMNIMGYEFIRTETKSVEVSIGENMTVLQIAALAVRYVKCIGGVRVPLPNSFRYKFL